MTALRSVVTREMRLHPLQDAKPPPNSWTTTLSYRVKGDFRVPEIQRFQLFKTLGRSSRGRSRLLADLWTPTGRARWQRAALLCAVALSGRRSQHPSLPRPSPLKRTSQWQEPREWPAAVPPCSRDPHTGCHSGLLHLSTPTRPGFPGEPPPTHSLSLVWEGVLPPDSGSGHTHTQHTHTCTHARTHVYMHDDTCTTITQGRHGIPREPTDADPRTSLEHPGGRHLVLPVGAASEVAISPSIQG